MVRNTHAKVFNHAASLKVAEEESGASLLWQVCKSGKLQYILFLWAAQTFVLYIIVYLLGINLKKQAQRKRQQQNSKEEQLWDTIEQLDFFFLNYQLLLLHLYDVLTMVAVILV